MFRELQGRSDDVAEGLDCALEGYEKFLDVEGTWRRGANTGLRQERFWATWCKIEDMWALGTWYVTCLKCLYAYLLRRELSAAAGWCRLGGQKTEVRRWSIWAYIARCNAILSRNQLLGHAWWFEIQLPESLHGGMIFGVGAEMRKQKRIFIFRYMEQFQEKLRYTLI